MSKLLSCGLYVLLHCMPVQPVLNSYLAAAQPSTAATGQLDYSDILSGNSEKNGFVRACLREYPHYSENEARNIMGLLRQGVAGSLYPECGIFTVIRTVAGQSLRMDGESVCCRHQEIVRWRETVHGMGQTMFINAFMAAEDARHGQTRSRFDFSPFARSDNLRLRQMLTSGMAENHFHLKGSAPAFLLSWVCLMNHIKGRDEGFRQMEPTFFPNAEEDKANSLYALTVKAAAIRLFLTQLLNGDYGLAWYNQQLSSDNGKTDSQEGPANDEKQNGTRDLIETIVAAESDSGDARGGRPIIQDSAWPMRRRLGSAWANSIMSLQQKINAERSRFPNSLDYVLDTAHLSSAYAAIAGENAFLYRMFWAIYTRDQDMQPFWPLFHAYLLICVRVRSELVQSNKAVGFHNFYLYQNRKEIFLDDYPAYAEALLRMAHRSALDNPALISLEARVNPKKKPGELDKAITHYIRCACSPAECRQCSHYSTARQRCARSRQICGPERMRTFYVFSLAKEPDKTSPLLKKTSRTYRHYRYRRSVIEPNIASIMKWRRGRSPAVAHVYGLDACSQEIGCRPEVFAPYFRQVRAIDTFAPSMYLGEHQPPLLRITYHAGEDFLDISDGLRAIDEAVLFLGLGPGDRLGHALALGIDPAHWYRHKGHIVILPRQDLLDNAVWLYMKAISYGFADHVFSHEIQSLVQREYHYIYSEDSQYSFRPVDVADYWGAWRLRGDHPEHYYRPRARKDHGYEVHPHKSAYLQDDLECCRLREGNPEAWRLMHRYHYDHGVRQKGAEIAEWAISPVYLQMVQKVQQGMQRDIAAIGIGIECNPSSNYLIGTFKDYGRHPLVCFNNEGLVVNTDSPQLFVSINTDDQGIFDTDLENEYALMAGALEAGAGDGGPGYTPAQVYAWLDNIRRMGLDQSFKAINRTLGGR